MKKALIVGIDNYPNSPLKGCVNDAQAMATLLETNGDGSPNMDIKLITAPSEAGTKSQIKAAIENLFSGPADLAFLYFSGHGFIDSTGGYLVTTDATAYDEGISMDTILSLANQSEAKDKAIVLDCCHSGAMGSPKLTGGNAAVISDGLTVLTASRDSESALEINGAGVFTSLLTDALQGGAADLRGNITPGAIYAYVDEALGAWDQRPIFKTNISKFSSWRKIEPRIPLDTLRKLVDYFASPSDEFDLDPSYEYTEPNHSPENAAVFKDLQKFEGGGLVVPVDEEHMYHAAMNSKSCRLTAIGHQYWRLAKERKI